MPYLASELAKRFVEDTSLGSDPEDNLVLFERWCEKIGLPTDITWAVWECYSTRQST